MATGTGKRVGAKILDADREKLLTLQSLEDYAPHNQEYSLTTLQERAMTLTKAEEAEVIAWRAFEVARERAVQAGIAFHEAILGAKAAVVAQYGEDSPAVHAVGRKRKSERSRPARRQPSAD